MRFAFFVLFIILQNLIYSQSIVPYKNSLLDVHTRVQDLLNRMTPEEKFRQLFMVAGDLGKNPEIFQTGLFGFQVSADPLYGTKKRFADDSGTHIQNLAEKINSVQKYFIKQSRLGIPIIAFDEALHGLVQKGATVFPQSIGLAATWDTALVHQVAEAVAAETRAGGIRQILSPVVNLATDVRWGRVEETYGEDPFLTSAMAVAYVRAFEKKGIITTPKHFVVNHGAGGRDSYPVHSNERELNESYFKPFKSCIQLGGSRSIMTAYNSLNGRPCSANDWLLNKKLKTEWGFTGFVISDAAATGGANVLHFTAKDYADAGKQAIENGLDVIFQTGFSSFDLFKDPFLNGAVDRAKLDSAVTRVLTAKFELGLFENPYVRTDTKIDYQAHRQISNDAALKSFVLLKNDALNILPLPGNIKNIAVIGTDAVEARLGGYSGEGNDKMNMLDGLITYFAGRKKISYAPGCGRESKTTGLVPAAYLFHLENGKRIQGLAASYYNNILLEGNPVLQRTDKQINFQWTLYGPDPVVQFDFFSVNWTGYLVAPSSGEFQIGVEGNDGYQLFLNGKLIIDTQTGQSFQTRLVRVYFEKGKACPIELRYREPSGGAKLKLVWTVDIADSGLLKIKEAVRLAEKNDLAIIVAGLEEGEFRDRSSLALPGKQEMLINKIAETGKPVLVLIVGGSAVTMQHWINHVSAVLQIWYPGETGGKAVAEIISGAVNPSGKLPITFPVTEGQLPLVYNHLPTGRGDDYLDGSGQAMFPFGFGLSYTAFAYSNLVFEKKQINNGESVQIRCTIKNTGKRHGEEVVQLYIRDEISTVARAVKELKGFQRVSLGPGETKEISFFINPGMLSFWNEQMQQVTEPGTFRIMIGSSSKDIRLRDILTVN
jgi:beta-glucosidase